MIIKVENSLREALLVATSLKEEFQYTLGGNKVSAGYLCSLVPENLKPLLEDGTFVILSDEEYQTLPYELWEYVQVVHR